MVNLIRFDATPYGLTGGPVSNSLDSNIGAAESAATAIAMARSVAQASGFQTEPPTYTVSGDGSMTWGDILRDINADRPEGQKITLAHILLWNNWSCPDLSACLNAKPDVGLTFMIADPTTPASWMTRSPQDGILAYTAQKHSPQALEQKSNVLKQVATRKVIEAEIRRQEEPSAVVSTDPMSLVPNDSPLRAQLQYQMKLQFAYETMAKAGGENATARNLPEGWFDNPEHPDWPSSIGAAMGVIRAESDLQRQKNDSQTLIGCILGPIYHHVFSGTNPASALGLVTAWGVGEEILPNKPFKIESQLPGGYTLVKTISRNGGLGLYECSYGLKPPGAVFGGTVGLTEQQAQGLFDRSVLPSTIKAQYTNTATVEVRSAVETTPSSGLWRVTGADGQVMLVSANTQAEASATFMQCAAVVRGGSVPRAGGVAVYGPRAQTAELVYAGDQGLSGGGPRTYTVYVLKDSQKIELAVAYGASAAELGKALKSAQDLAGADGHGQETSVVIVGPDGQRTVSTVEQLPNIAGQVWGATQAPVEQSPARV
jgi:hypothetical protein